jgi:hypothetical protein
MAHPLERERGPGRHRTRLWKCWDLWEVPGVRLQSVLAAARRDPEIQEWAALLVECVEEEELRYVVELPYAH